MKIRDRETIPAFLSIDVEPDAFQISCDEREHWPGYGTTFEFAVLLRHQLAQASGAKPIFGWYYRMDPQIEQVCGRADFAITAFPERTGALCEEGDYFGVHTHPLRWSNERRLWVHDLSDRQWLRDCTKFSLDAFTACNGSPTKHFRSGAAFLCDDIVDVLDKNGVVVDLSLEPVAGWGLHSKKVQSAVDSSPIVGEYTNCVTAPKTPYHPSHEDFRRPAYGDGRRILLVPLATGPAALPSGGLISKLKRRLHGTSKPNLVMLDPTEDDWPGERCFWDVVSHQLGAMERPFLSLAIRTDRFESRRAARVRRVFTALAQHPLAKRLRFVDPVEVKEQITPQFYRSNVMPSRPGVTR